MNDQNRVIYQSPGPLTLTSALLLVVPLGLGLVGLWGVWQANRSWDDVLFVPLGICGALILISVVGAYRIVRRQGLPRPTRTLIFDNESRRVYLSPRPWTSGASTDLATLPSYGYDQFTGWKLRTSTVSGPGNDRINRSTYYSVSLSKTDGGHFDVYETGWEPSAETVLRAFRSQIPLAGRSSLPVPVPDLPGKIHRETSVNRTLYRWNSPWSWAGTLSSLMYLGVVMGGFFLVVGSAPGEEGQTIRLVLGGLLATGALVIVLVGLSRWRRARRTVQTLVIRPGVLESGSSDRNRPDAETLTVSQSLPLQGTIHVRSDRVVNDRATPSLWLVHEDGSSLLLELEGLSDGDLVVLEQSLEADIRRHGGIST